MNKTEVKTTKTVYPQIYDYILPNLSEKDGWQKIGYTERENVDTRILEQVKTAAVDYSKEYQKRWVKTARFEGDFENDDEGWFDDKKFHRFLKQHTIPNGEQGKEWFYFNGTPEVAEQLFDQFVKKDFSGVQISNQGTDYQLRIEQQDAVNQSLEYFQNHENGEFLWNAKPRFGKTLSTYDLARKLDAQMVLIVTNRPAIANSWYDDFEKFIAWQTDYKFVSESDSLKNRPTLSRSEWINTFGVDDNAKLIEFISLQDLKGSRYFGGAYDKLKEVADLEWDLLVIDEAHEGVDTFKTDIAFEHIKRKNTLHLTGTPFKALAAGKFSSDAIYNWSYEDEQNAKAVWEVANEENSPYHNLPTLNLFTYQLSQMITDKIKQGAALSDSDNVDYTFDLNEFFKTKDNGVFEYEADVKKFLDSLTKYEKFPFSTPELRNEIKHSFWLLNRVASAKALEKLLKAHPVFENYEIILAAGNGKTTEEEAENASAVGKSFDRVKEAIKNHDKTITLSVGQLTTGVTIPEWTAVFMLSNLSSPALYMQAAFRAQNPWTFTDKNGTRKQKENAYIFDFAPERTLIIFDEFANNLSSKAVSATEARTENIKKLLNFFPVIGEDSEGKMVELDAAQVLTIPKVLKTQEVVRRGFMSNLLFANISGIFAYSDAYKEILDRLPVEKQGKLDKPSTMPNVPAIDIDNKGQAIAQEEIVISKTDAIFGDKVFSLETPDIEAILENTATPEEELKQAAVAAIVPNLDKVAAHFDKKLTKNQIEAYQKQTENRIDEVVKKEKAELEIIKAHIETEKTQAIEQLKQENQTPETLEIEAAELEQTYTEKVEAAQSTFVEKVAEKTQEAVNAQAKSIVREQEQKQEQKKVNTAMEDVRSRLRGFARTIPSFIMAYGDRKLTLSNFDEYTPDEVFAELTGITEEQFRQLRDGMTITDEDGTVHEVPGLFDAPTFDTSVQEFLDKKEKLADYFDESKSEDIFDYIPPQKTNQIFTPKRVVKMMVDLLEKENPDIFKNPETKFIDLYAKSGLYVTELVKKLKQGLKEQLPDESIRIKHILEHQVYAVAPTNIIYNIAKNFVFSGLPEVSSDNIKECDLASHAQAGQVKAKLAELYGEEMKFDVVIGNPPYQEENLNRNRDDAIYHTFMDEAYKIADIVEFITPARFLFNVGSTPSVWNNKMLNDEHLSVVYFEHDAKNIFPNTEIIGPVAVTYRNALKNVGKIGTFTPFVELNSIIKKVNHISNGESINSLMYVQNKFELKELFADFPEYKEKLGSSGKERRLTSSIFEVLPEIFYSESQDKNELSIYGRLDNKRTYKFINKKYLEKHENEEFFKVFVPAANGASGTLGEHDSARIISTPVLGKPNTGHTQTFISIGKFSTEFEAQALLKYVKSKFGRAMLGSLKVTQNNKTKETWSNVPFQDFTPNSDIDWTKSIPEIDQQLYAKYGLSQDEIDFIEEKVKAME
ncbi:MAG: Eco57I restriction-modification methylase domain-containing protein [Lactococcus hircilactis]